MTLKMGELRAPTTVTGTRERKAQEEPKARERRRGCRAVRKMCLKINQYLWWISGD
jgi:hypothetical protein